MVNYGPGLQSLSSLGYCEDGVSVNIQPRFDEIFSDDMGGRGGVPSDAQLLGATATIDCLFTKYVKTLLDNIASFSSQQMNTATKGLMPAIGSFVRQDSLAGVLVLTGINESLTFATAVLKRNYEVNSGTRYRRYICGFECWVNQTDYTLIAQAQTRRLFTMV